VSIESSCVLLQWLCTSGSECVSLENSCVILVDYIVVSGLLDGDIMEIYLPRFEGLLMFHHQVKLLLDWVADQGR
jgi:hypothetical protein